MTNSRTHFDAVSPSGLGGQVSQWTPATPELIRDIALSTGMALARNLTFDEESFRTFVAGLGDKVAYEDDDADVGYGFLDVLHLDGNRDEGKVITGRGPLPLHTDGVLLGTQVDLIVLYAAEITHLSDDGATLICDQISAWRDMPAELCDVLKRGTLEYVATERGYFTTVPDGWYPIPTFRDYGRVKSLNVALPFPPGAPASWDVRVPGMPADESRSYFAALTAHLSQDQYLYAHRRQRGDLVVIDNQRTLRGRRGLSDTAGRKLLRGQVTLDPMAGAPGATSEGM